MVLLGLSTRILATGMGTTIILEALEQRLLKLFLQTTMIKLEVLALMLLDYTILILIGMKIIRMFL